jgi:M6 family metalloprotease-like protein
MPAARSRWFKTHRSTAARRAFVAKQQQRLAALQHAAACTVAVPTSTTTTTTAAPPVDTGQAYSPRLSKPSWADDPSQTPTPEYGEWPVDHDRFISATTARVLMLFVDFPDAPGTLDPKAVYDAYVPPGLKWLATASYGRADVKVDYLPRWYRMPQASSAYPVRDERNDAAAMRSVAATAFSLADGDVDFSKYDAVFIWGSSNNFTVTQLRTWPGAGVVDDGKEIDHVEFEDAGIPSGVWDDLGHPMDTTASANLQFTHELLHHMGTPDSSYKPDATTPYDFSYVGGWDMQDSPAGISHGADYFAWNKWRLGWLDASQLRGLDAPGTLETTLTPVETAGGVKAVVVPATPSLAYVVEVRRRLGNDANMTCDEGVLVYTVDSTKRNGQAPVFVEPGHPSTDSSRISTCGLKYAAPFQVGEAFEDSSVKVEVLSTDGTNYSVRVTRK